MEHRHTYADPVLRRLNVVSDQGIQCLLTEFILFIAI